MAKGTKFSAYAWLLELGGGGGRGGKMAVSIALGMRRGRSEGGGKTARDLIIN